MICPKPSDSEHDRCRILSELAQNTYEARRNWYNAKGVWQHLKAIGGLMWAEIHGQAICWIGAFVWK